MYIAITIFGSLGVVSLCVIAYYLLRRCKGLSNECFRLSHKIEVIESETDNIRRGHEARYHTRVQTLKNQFTADNTLLISQALCSQSATQLSGDLKEIIEKRYGRMSQEFLGNLSDDAEGLVRDLQFELSEKIWDSHQQFKEKSDESPLLLPKDVVIAYTKGCRTVMVIEQKPQMRTTGFSYAITSQSDREAAARKSENGYWFSLSFPFVYFFIVFDHGRYSHHQVHFRNSQLTSAREHVYLAPIPNVYRSKKTEHVCMGGDFRGELSGQNTIARKCDMIVGDFWQRVFNNELGEGGFKKIDKKLKSLRVWQENSLEDPLFILNVKWKQGKTVKGVVEKILDGRKMKEELDAVDETIRDLLNDGVKKITKKVKEEMKSAKSAHEFKPKDLDDPVKQLLEEVVVAHSRKVFDQCTKPS